MALCKEHLEAGLPTSSAALHEPGGCVEPSRPPFTILNKKGAKVLETRTGTKSASNQPRKRANCRPTWLRRFKRRSKQEDTIRKIRVADPGCRPNKPPRLQQLTFKAAKGSHWHSCLGL